MSPAAGLSKLSKPLRWAAQVGAAPRGYTLIPPGALDTWAAALADHHGQRVKIVIIGDSVGVGWAATDRGTQGWAPLLRAELQAEYGNGGGASLGITDELGAYWMHYTDWTRSGFANGDGFGLYLFSAKGSPGNYLERTWSGRYIVVHWKDSTSNADDFTVQIDGGGAQNVSAGNDNAYHATEFDAGTDGAHTIRINATATASKFTWITGCIPYKTLDGVSVINASYAGRRIDTYVSGAFGSALDELATIGPDLVIYSLTINDYNTQYSLANFSARYDTAIAKAAAAGADCMLIVNNAIQAVQPIPLSNYQNILWGKARLNGLALLDIYRKWGSYTQANAAGLMGDATHPSTDGHADMAEEALEVIT